MTKASIIIPTRQLKRDKNIRFFYKKISSLSDLLADIKDNVVIEHEVIVVCNGIKDKDLIEYVQSSALVDKYAVLNQNSGVSRAWNIGRMLAEGEMLLFINDDVKLGKNAVETMYEYLNGNDKVGEVGPKGGLWHGDSSGERTGLEKPEEADEISGFCFMTKVAVYDEVAGFDIAYTPAGFEEIDYSFKVRKAGYKCMVVPNLDIHTEPCHGISARNEDIVYFDNTINTKVLHEKNRSYFLDKWYGK